MHSKSSKNSGIAVRALFLRLKSTRYFIEVNSAGIIEILLADNSSLSNVLSLQIYIGILVS